jgi:hypothetical protein
MQEECYETVAAQGGEQTLSRHDACNDRNVTRAIFDKVRYKRAERLLQEWTRSTMSRNLTEDVIYTATSHTCGEVAGIN